MRFLVAGMGDALGTFYESRACHNGPTPKTIMGARMTETGLATARLSKDLLFHQRLDVVATQSDGNRSLALSEWAAGERCGGKAACR